MKISDLVTEAHANACDKGFWDVRGVTDEQAAVEKLCLIHSEVSEALEWLRDADARSCYVAMDGKPEGFVIELADVVIRIADLCGKLKLDLNDAVRCKMAYNRTRSVKHGKKF